jgi:biopolymer transport protein TolQ
MATDLSVTHLVLNASPLVQLVMLTLLLASVISWTMIFRKWNTLKGAQAAANDFEQRFWSGGDLGAMYKEIVARGRDRITGMEGLFEAGFKEFARLRKQNVEPRAVVEGSHRAMRVALSRETDNLETHLSFLATVGSTSPYIGLFGTVWGIMNAFIGLGNVHQATLAMVAPGIAEALIATAMGLFAAIPAVIAYNRYSNDVERLINRYDTFLEEFSTILQRQAHV